MKHATRIALVLSTAAALGVGVAPARATPDVPGVRVVVDPPTATGNQLDEVDDAVDLSGRIAEGSVYTVQQLLSDNHCVYVYYYVTTNPFDGADHFRKCPWMPWE